MLSHLLNPFSFSEDDYASYQWGARISFLGGAIPESCTIALLSYAQDKSEYFLQLRKALYRLSANFEQHMVIDLGAVKGSELGLKETLDILLKKGILPIVLTDQVNTVAAQLDYYKLHKQIFSSSFIHSHLDYQWKNHKKDRATTELGCFLKHYPMPLCQLSCIGYQSYFVDNLVLDLLDSKHISLYRLGSIRSKLTEIEPMLRDTDFLYFNLSSIKSSDAPNTLFANPNGFSGEEACTIVRYAALGDRLKHICLSAYTENQTDRGQTARLVAQMIWYIVLGFKQRKHDYPISLNDFTHYAVDSTYTDEPLQFIKSLKSARWWFRPNNKKWEDSDEQDLISCSHRDYLTACEGELTDRILRALKEANRTK